MSYLESMESQLDEYRSMTAVNRKPKKGAVDPDRLVRELVRNHDWTESGAQAIVDLANQYGAFMLSNALALALAIEKHDGDLRH